MSVPVMALKDSPEDLRQRTEAEAEVQLAGMLFRVGDELRHGRGRHGRRHHQHLRAHRQHGDADEALHRVEIEIGIERGRDDQAGRADQQCIAVRLGGRRNLGADRGAGARPVVDHDGLREPRGKLLGDNARQHVDRRAWRIGHDHLDGLGRIGWSALRRGACQSEPQESEPQEFEPQAECRDRENAPVCHCDLPATGFQLLARCPCATSRSQRSVSGTEPAAVSHSLQWQWQQ